MATDDQRADEPARVIATAGEKGVAVPGAGTMGMYLFVASLSVLFAASMIGYLIIRLRSDVWPPPGAAPLPRSLWISTAVILASSVTMHQALRAIRKGSQRALVRWLWATFALGVLFLVLQAGNWWTLVESGVAPSSSLYGFMFYVFSGLHAVHVIGGLIGLAIVAVWARSGRYTWAYFPGIRYVSIYWHFLDGTWLVIFSAMYLAG